MEMLKKFFPFSFTAKKDVVALVINIIIYLVVGAVIGIVIASTIVILPPVKVLIEPGYTFAAGLKDILLYVVAFAVGAVAAWALSLIQKDGSADKTE